MNLYQFIASVVGSLAWPTAVAFIFWLFRKELRKVLQMRLKYGDLDVSILLDKAEKEAAKEPLPAPAEPKPQLTHDEDQFDRLVELSPRAAVLQLRTQLEESIRKFAQGRGVKLTPLHTSATFIARVLIEKRAIDPHTAALLDDLRMVGNAAAHKMDEDLSVDDARRFKTLYEVVVARFRAIESGQIKL